MLPPPTRSLQFEEAELAAASQLLREEAEAVRAAMGHADTAPAEYVAAWQAVAADVIFVPSQGRYNRAASVTNADRVASVQVSWLGCWVGHGVWAVGCGGPLRWQVAAAAHLCCLLLT